MNKLILVATMVTGPAALAQQPAAAPPPRSAPSADVNAGLDMQEMVCRSRETLGSRLARQRVCATRQQWLEQQRMDRLYTEKAQTTRIWPQ